MLTTRENMIHKMLPSLFLLCVTLMAYAVSAAQTSGPAPGAVWVVSIDGAIGPAISDYVIRSIDKAENSEASLIILKINTPGGLDNSMRDIIQAILASDVPVASFVAPKGARAASAGTYILYASHFAVMAPATSLGAATPVQIGAPSMPSAPVPGGDDETEKAESQGSTAMERKIVNDAAAYIRGLAELRGRNIEWAEEAVRLASSLTAAEALDRNVIDFIANDLEHLLVELDGQTTAIKGREVEMELADKKLFHHAPDWRTQFLTILTNPNLVLVLGMIGIYGIILEFYNPGSMVPGTVGVICLILAGYSLQLLPVNYAGLALLVLGIILMIAEAMVPSFGVLGIGGIIAFSIGALMLFDTEIEAFQIGTPVIISTAIVSAAIIIATISIAMKMRTKIATTGVEAIVGRLGEALTGIEKEGQVKIGGEIWKAKSTDEIAKGDRVKVLSVDGLMLIVEKSEE